MPKQGLKNHIVICNWNEKGLKIIKEAHASIIEDKRPIVIVSETADSIELSAEEDIPEFENVYLVNGDPTNKVILKRANVHQAHSVVILVNQEEREVADSKSILICMAIKSICEENNEPKTYISVERRFSGTGKGDMIHLSIHRQPFSKLIEHFSDLHISLQVDRLAWDSPKLAVNTFLAACVMGSKSTPRDHPSHRDSKGPNIYLYSRIGPLVFLSIQRWRHPVIINLGLIRESLR